MASLTGIKKGGGRNKKGRTYRRITLSIFLYFNNMIKKDTLKIKNDRPVSRVLYRREVPSAPIIYLGLRSPATSICLPPEKQSTGSTPPRRAFRYTRHFTP